MYLTYSIRVNNFFNLLRFTEVKEAVFHELKGKTDVITNIVLFLFLLYFYNLLHFAEEKERVSHELKKELKGKIT